MNLILIQRGPVKDFSQTLMNENGEVAKQVTGTLSQDGCFDTLELHELENNSLDCVMIPSPVSLTGSII